MNSLEVNSNFNSFFDDTFVFDYKENEYLWRAFYKDGSFTFFLENEINNVVKTRKVDFSYQTLRQYKLKKKLIQKHKLYKQRLHAKYSEKVGKRSHGKDKKRDMKKMNKLTLKKSRTYFESFFQTNSVYNNLLKRLNLNFFYAPLGITVDRTLTDMTKEQKLLYRNYIYLQRMYKEAMLIP